MSSLSRLGLPHKVLSSGGIEQVDDISKSGLAGVEPETPGSAFAFPILLGSEVWGVVELLIDHPRSLAPDEMSLLESLGKQMGQFAQRRQAEAGNIQLANIVQSSNDAIIGHTLEGTITSWNRGAERIFGYTQQEMNGKPISVLLPQDKADEFYQSMTGSWLTETMDSHEAVWIKKNDTPIDVSLSQLLVADEEGRLVGLSTIVRDITEKKEAEKRVNEFYSMVSHELRTPLTSVRGALGLIEGGVVEQGSDESMELVQVARESADRLIRLINDILDLKKIESGKMELHKSEIDPSELVTTTLHALFGMAGAANVYLAPDIRTDAHVFADRDKTTQVLTNLVSNAIKFSPAQSQVMVTTEITDTGKVRFSVIDNGPGIAPEDQHKLFGKFQQLDSSDTRPKGGTGLGLPSPRPSSRSTKVRLACKASLVAEAPSGLN